ncbi:hypothetical protein DZF91_23970 [Actinomadura logoneensis]|uniref:Uncharacterized protein n=1 Tax=Actinomadura logoneensis TaxID=2293572 RepID=A0A372JGL6_9ACTN|nr:hypothetical protein [Actinomadura logoneensis]RFU39142.1 hypothetical protein DZF91_23970 [Actinomadura logoneensis]
MTGTAVPYVPASPRRTARDAARGTAQGDLRGAAQRTPRRRHGLAGLFVVLFALAGLLFSYGLEHTPPPDLCHPHGPAWSAPVTGGTHIRLAPGDAAATPAAMAPTRHTPPSPAQTCLCLAVLLGIMLLALGARPDRWRLLLPARLGWRPAVPARPSPAPLSLASLQVLRL